jgi:hypothetical protein
MKDLHDILRKEKYKKIRFKVTKTQHLLIKATINGVRGNFILDTGASNSCVGFECIASQTQESNAIFKTKNNLKLCYENSLQKTQSQSQN